METQKPKCRNVTLCIRRVTVALRFNLVFQCKTVIHAYVRLCKALRHPTKKPSCYCQWLLPGACSLSLLHTLCVHRPSFFLPQTINHVELFLSFSTRGSPTPQCTFTFLFYSIYFVKPQEFALKTSIIQSKLLYNC